MDLLVSIPGERKVLLNKRSSAIKKGETIRTFTPLFLTLNTGLFDSHCSGCLRTAKQLSEELKIPLASVEEGMLLCKRCKTHMFCSLRCYAKSWALHVDECRGLARTDSCLPTTRSRLVAKVLVERRSQNKLVDPIPHHFSQSSPDLTERTAHTVIKLMADIDNFAFRPSTDIKGIKDHVIRLLGEVEEDEDGWVFVFKLEKYHLGGDDDWNVFIRRVLSCVFTIYDVSANPIGVCLSPELSHIRHSCEPNSQLVWQHGPRGKSTIRLVANKAICPGDEITISYIDLTIPIHLRQAALKPFGFIHSKICKTCSGTYIDLRWATTHEGCTRAGLIPLPPFRLDSTFKNDRRSFVGISDSAGCDRCLTSVQILGPWRAYQKGIHWVKDSVEKEKEGVILPCCGADVEAIEEEFLYLRDIIPILLRDLAPTVHPIPYLQLRCGRLAIFMPHSIPNLHDAIKLWSEAYSSFLTLNDNTPTPLTCHLSCELVQLHVDLIRMYKALVEGKRCPPTPRPKFRKLPNINDDNDDVIDAENKEEKDIKRVKPDTKWVEENWKKFEHLIAHGREWIITSKSHLKALGYSEEEADDDFDDDERFKKLERCDREFDELDLWLNLL